MPQLSTDVGPGQISTVTPAGPGPGGPSDLENFYRELLRRQTVAAQVPQPVASGYAAPGQGYSNGIDPRAMQYRPEQTQFDREREQDARQEMAYRQRLREIDLNPPVKYIDSRPGVQGGYLQDVTMLPLSLRPKESNVARGGLTPEQYAASSPEGQRKIQEDEEQLRRQRAQNVNYYGRS